MRLPGKAQRAAGQSEIFAEMIGLGGGVRSQTMYEISAAGTNAAVKPAIASTRANEVLVSFLKNDVVERRCRGVHPTPVSAGTQIPKRPTFVSTWARPTTWRSGESGAQHHSDVPPAPRSLPRDMDSRQRFPGLVDNESSATARHSTRLAIKSAATISASRPAARRKHKRGAGNGRRRPPDAARVAPRLGRRRQPPARG